MKFIWDAKYSVGIKTIDSQHQKFFEIINEIYFLIRQQQIDLSKVSKVVNELAAYADFHLAYEEKCFKDFDYPQADMHCAAHDVYRSAINKYLTAINEPNANVTKIANDIADFVQNWLSTHIMTVDHKYSQFFLIHDIK
jgi:hemerythrin-like metal-binding protein